MERALPSLTILGVQVFATAVMDCLLSKIDRGSGASLTVGGHLFTSHRLYDLDTFSLIMDWRGLFALSSNPSEIHSDFQSFQDLSSDIAPRLRGAYAQELRSRLRECEAFSELRSQLTLTITRCSEIICAPRA